MDDSVQVIFHPLDKVVRVKRGVPLIDVLREAGIHIEAICGGKGQCKKCKVILSKGECTPIIDDRIKGLSPEDLARGYLLACQVSIESDCELIIPVESRIDAPQILLNADMKIGELTPAATKYPVVITSTQYLPTSGGSIKLKGYSGPRPYISQEIYGKITAVKDVSTATVSWTNEYPEIIRIESGDTTKSNYGLALDLGTTTIVGVLIDLTTGGILAGHSTMNKQITYGEEVITRIAYATQSGGLKKLQAMAVDSINEIVNRLESSEGVMKTDISDVCIGCNTVMNHLLIGKDPEYLEMANANVSRKPHIVKAKTIGMDINPETNIYCLPNVSRFVGGDAVGDIIASGMHETSDLSLLVDLGTNGEIIFGNEDWLVSASCASGPAFEGAGITFGMRGMRGAIEHVSIDRQTFEATYSVINDVAPKGICGSAVIDAVAEMFAAGILDFTGKLVAGLPKVRKGIAGLEYVLVPAEQTQIGWDIVITQGDMAYIMDSKAGVCGAIGVLMKKYKISINDVAHVYLAGAFGAYANTKKLMEFGILPAFPQAQFHTIGNGSLSGAFATLVSMKNRQVAQKIAEKMVYIDLLVDVDFIEEYTAALYIPGKREFFPL